MTEMTGSRLRGSLTALVTPFRDGAFDEAAFRKFVRWQIEQGSHGLVPTGTTGESPTLTHAEHDRVVEACIDEAGGRCRSWPARAPTPPPRRSSGRSTPSARDADAVLVVTPYYNKPTQAGLYAHFKAVNDASRHSDHHLQYPAALPSST
ncbi:dihydrodipicolinate synthase family protein [Methylobacterium oryzae CBMB20]